MVSPSAQVVGAFPRCIWKSSNDPGPAGGVRQIDEIIKTNPDRQLSVPETGQHRKLSQVPEPVSV